MKHQNASELSGQEVAVVAGRYAGMIFSIEDWWDRVSGRSWGDRPWSAEQMVYAARMVRDRRPPPPDEEVLCGKIGGVPVLIHLTEIKTDRGIDPDFVAAGWSQR